jgi:RimJ/RimL family protein N-acetyltransferase
VSFLIESPRLRLSPFELSDAEDVFACITPAMTRYMAWEAPSSFDEYRSMCERRAQSVDQKNLSWVIRLKETRECLGMAGLENIDNSTPELGLWLKEAAYGHGFGSEVVRAVAAWASCALKKESFIYPVAVQNIASRRIAEKLDGEIIGQRTSPKYDSVVYKIPAMKGFNP